MTNGNHAQSCTIVASIVFAFVLLLPAIGVTDGSRLEPVDPSRVDKHALWLGRRVLAIAAAVRIPGAMEAVLELGLALPYYMMLRC